MQDYDEATAFLGEWGPFQRIMFLLLSITIIPNGYVGLSMVFLADTPQHHCRLPNSLNGTTGEANLSSLLPVEEVDGEMIYSRCRRYKTPVTDGFNDTTRETEPCVNGWEYSTDRYISTIVSQWDLVCDNDWKGPMSLSMIFLGNLCGAIISGQVSDRYGRKVVLFGGIAMQTILSFMQMASSSWEMFSILCFFIGVGDISNYVTAFVLGAELFSKSVRITFTALGICLTFAIGYAILPLIAYFVREWKLLILALFLPELLFFPLWWFIPESPRWLLSQGRVEEAEAIVKAAAKKNGIKHVGEIFQRSDNMVLKSTNKLKSKHNYVDLVRTFHVRIITVISLLIWVITAISYYGLTLSTSNMYGNPYINCFISAVTDMVAYIISWRLMLHAPRRISTASMLLLGGSILLLVRFVPTSLHILTLILVMIGKSGIAISYAIIYIFTAELYPTLVRNMGLGACSMASRGATIISPYLVYLGTYNKDLPFMLMGGLSIMAGFFCFILPETYGQRFPDTIQQAQPVKCCWPFSLMCRQRPPSSFEISASQQRQSQNGNTFLHSLTAVQCTDDITA
ncbi:solute carrier family 22 member 5 isoform X1 [Callorhinchus milii]|uniref:Solute carrier family 22 member 5-like n=1 Tax=Callorhinchus milii TaxID=7868 RepID=V9KM19_CALMI|nr:solute carrier family 22 member 5 isoform X1 [Callorhinchus milii]XP_042198465.1 solute carrier family 22 member 5 isoform X1 [Callorhinchus milii]XP_042198471.1 solute carrier family 22 member 5 isoform X1 [Callorhinchus milii]|eukprot:gi/632976923/ref/XP_007905061.1/ PREDICTED: solute carrier family 22 member 5-like isoform X2 [Callorhinchus milii]